MSPFLDSIESRLGKSKYLVGDKLCMVDFWVGAMYGDKCVNPEHPFKAMYDKVLAAHPNFKRYGDEFVKENAAWIAKREKAAM
jgi:glutathione S-transferase